MSDCAHWFLASGDIARNTISSFAGEPQKLVVVLASASENRKKLLEQIGINPVICPSTCPEDLPRTLPLVDFVEQTAKQKAIDVFGRLKNEKINFDIVIGCDTMISIDGQKIGKPRDEEDAFAILNSLDGRKHLVRTGVCLLTSEGQEELFSVETEVEFGQNGHGLIRQYIATGEPMGRAGAYAIQGKGAVLIKTVNGSFSNVVGLPLHEFAKKLAGILDQC